MKKSQAGRFYHDGKPLENNLRYKIVDCYGEGREISEIATELAIDPRTVKKTLNNYMESGDLEYLRKTKPSVIANENVIDAIEYYLYRKPSVYLKEIQQMLIEDNICEPYNVPDESYICRIIKNKLVYSRKKLKVKAKEGLTEAAMEKFDTFLDNIEDVNPMKLHWFDESSVIMTTGNRRMGYSAVGEPAIELQKYASNASYTINLLQSSLGVDYFNVIEGASNGLQLLDFFIDAVNEKDIYGYNKLSPGDVVIMDNCGFHHGHLAETYLRDMLRQHGINMIFQPPYSPELNTCEKSFSKLKYYLRKHTRYTETYPELAICDGVNEISHTDCFHYAKHCGYF